MTRLDCGCTGVDRYYVCRRCRASRCAVHRAFKHVCLPKALSGAVDGR